MLTAMFVSFIVQVFMRYVIDSPVGWTVEMIAWVWVILWGQSLSATESDEIREAVFHRASGSCWRRNACLTRFTRGRYRFFTEAAVAGLQILSGWELYFYQGLHA